jgi:hypothetical protein
MLSSSQMVIPNVKENFITQPDDDINFFIRLDDNIIIFIQPYMTSMKSSSQMMTPMYHPAR